MRFTLWHNLGQIVLSDSKVTQCCCLFRKEQINMHDEEHDSHSTVMTDVLEETINANIHENLWFIGFWTIQFHNVSRSVIYDTVTEIG